MTPFVISRGNPCNLLKTVGCGNVETLVRARSHTGLVHLGKTAAARSRERGARSRGFVFYPTTSTFWPFLLAKVVLRKMKTNSGGGLKPFIHPFIGKTSQAGSPS